MAEPGAEQGILQREIAELESLLREKRAAVGAENAPENEREEFREAFHEKYGESFAPAPPSDTPTPPPPLPQDIAGHHAAVVAAPENKEKLEALIHIALTKGVRTAAEVARRASPWLMDELHDTLQDQYYDRLIQAKQLKAL